LNRGVLVGGRRRTGHRQEETMAGKQKIPESSREAYRRAKGLASIRVYLETYCKLSGSAVTALRFGQVENILVNRASER
jgi:aminoglycoside phosphotransferase (APT) family kinase protein